MIQEAKPSCRGQWYLPAGRLEKNETFAEGAQRELEEEAGFKFQPTSIICLEGEGPGYVTSAERKYGGFRFSQDRTPRKFDSSYPDDHNFTERTSHEFKTIS